MIGSGGWWQMAMWKPPVLVVFHCCFLLTIKGTPDNLSYSSRLDLSECDYSQLVQTLARAQPSDIGAPSALCGKGGGTLPCCKPGKLMSKSLVAVCSLQQAKYIPDVPERL